jgi:hypothetical protein
MKFKTAALYIAIFALGVRRHHSRTRTQYDVWIGKTRAGIYFEALRHQMTGMGCWVQLYRAGFMSTTMLKGKTGLLVSSPRSVTQKMISRLDGPEGAAYASWKWVLIGLILCMLPYFIFRRLRI